SGGEHANRPADGFLELVNEAIDRLLPPRLGFLLGLFLAGEAVCLDHAVFEDLDSRCHLADLVLASNPDDFGRKIMAGEFRHRSGHENDWSGDAAYNHHGSEHAE